MVECLGVVSDTATQDISLSLQARLRPEGEIWVSGARLRLCLSSPSGLADMVLKAPSNMSTEEIRGQSARSFLLLVLDTVNILLWDILVLLRQPIVNVIAHVPLYRNLLPTTRSLGDTTASGKLLAQFFRNLLQIQPMLLESGNNRNVFALVSFHSLDEDFCCSLALALALLIKSCFSLLLGRVFLGSFLGIDRECGEVGV